MPSGDQTMDFSSIRFTHVSPLARRLFQIEGIVRVFYGKDYISVTKKEDLDWNVVKPEVLEVITDHYSKNQPLFTEDLPAEDTMINDDDSECVALIKEIIETRIRPFV
jgi:NFU1 iron-sulfur cluster scaffold homolog, mitochondrial